MSQRSIFEIEWVVVDADKILWIKSVSLDEDQYAYGPEDPAGRVREEGDAFWLHASELDQDSLADPAVGDIIVLTQHHHVTHLVEVIGESVQMRPKAELRSAHGRRFPHRRRVRVLRLMGFDEAPQLRKALGFDPRSEGGEVLRISDLRDAPEDLRTVQSHILRSIDGEFAGLRKWRKLNPTKPFDGKIRRLPRDERTEPK